MIVIRYNGYILKSAEGHALLFSYCRIHNSPHKLELRQVCEFIDQLYS